MADLGRLPADLILGEVEEGEEGERLLLKRRLLSLSTHRGRRPPTGLGLRPVGRKGRRGMNEREKRENENEKE